MLKDKIKDLNPSWIIEWFGADGARLWPIPFLIALVCIAAMVVMLRSGEEWLAIAYAPVITLAAIILGIIMLTTPGSAATIAYHSSVNTLVTERMTEKYSVTPETTILPADLITEGTIVVADPEALTTYKVSISFNEAGDLTLRHLDGKELNQIYG